LTETDSPYLTPEPKRGEFPNTPANIPYIAARIAALKGVSEEELTEQVITNAKRLFAKWR
jgi:TatD DNase family protein